MNQLIGVGSNGLLSADIELLKKCLLFYDQIIINSDDDLPEKDKTDKAYESTKNYLSSHGRLKEHSALLTLIEKGFIKPTDQTNISLKREFLPDEADYCNRLQKLWQDDYDQNLAKHLKEHKVTFGSNNVVEGLSEHNKFLHALRKTGDYRSRIYSYCNNIGSLDKTFLPISQVIDWTTISITEQPSASVTTVVINNLPAVDMTTHLDKLLEFKFDSDAISKKLALRSWINKASKGELNLKELSEELEYQLDEYRNHLELHRLKYKNKRLSIILTFPFQFIKNPMEAVNSLFELRESRLDLAESEKDAPGKEFAFIHKANNYFK